MVYHYARAGTVDHTLDRQGYSINDWMAVRRVCLTGPPAIAAPGAPRIDWCMAHSREEVQATLERYIAVRDEINAGKRHVGRPRPVLHRRRGVHRPRVGAGRGHRRDEAHRVRRRDGRVRGMAVPDRVLRDRGRQRGREVEAGAARHAAPTAAPTSSRACSTLIYAATASSATRKISSIWCTCSRTCAESKCPVPDVAMPPKHPNRDFSRP